MLESSHHHVPAPWLFTENCKYSDPYPDGPADYEKLKEKEKDVEKLMIEEVGKQVDLSLKEHPQTIEQLSKEVIEISHPLYQVLKVHGILSKEERISKLCTLQRWDSWDLQYKGLSHFTNLRFLYIYLNMLDYIQEQNEKEAQEKLRLEKEAEAQAKALEEAKNNPYQRLFNMGNPLYTFIPEDKEKKYPVVNIDYLKDLDRKVKELYDLKKQLPSTDEDLLGTITAKRRFLQDELLECDLATSNQTQDEVNKRLQLFEEFEVNFLKEYYINIIKVRDYTISEQRKSICPEFFPEFEYMYGHIMDYPESKDLIKSQISLEWFSNTNNTPEGYDPYEWLAKCEKLFKHSSYKDNPGLLFSKIDNHRVKIVIEYDDGIHLRMISGEKK
jgi:hypothetical protein